MKVMGLTAMDDTFQMFAIQRKIFGVCPHSGELFRLSDCRIYRKSRPIGDWMDEADAEMIVWMEQKRS